jgi:predicted nucleotidyltransferase component of viral defense system
VLGHFLNGLYQNEYCREHWLFKGGTCLKKCYFEDYRFSEDLDFTLTDQGFVLDEAFLRQVCDWVADTSGIRFALKELREMRFDGQKTGYRAEIRFWGADHARNDQPSPPTEWHTKLKLELIQYEQMVFAPERRTIFHPYSDRGLISAQPLCYALPEVLAEKLRALIQRRYTAPRDYYDIWYISQNVPALDWAMIVAAFYRKMAFKQLRFDGPEQMFRDTDSKKFGQDWQNTLQHHLPKDKLPESSEVLSQVKQLLTKIFNQSKK